MAQIIRITSEALQATVRRLLPSQQGFGEDLQASNVIQPIIDLTASAEGSEVRVDLQTALAFGSQTTFNFNNGSGTLANSAGFWRFTGTASTPHQPAGIGNVAINLNDGSTNKKIFDWPINGATGDGGVTRNDFDFTVFLRPGDSINAIANGTKAYCIGSYRQVADVNGVLVNPVGFTPQ